MAVSRRLTQQWIDRRTDQLDEHVAAYELQAARCNPSGIISGMVEAIQMIEEITSKDAYKTIEHHNRIDAISDRLVAASAAFEKECVCRKR